MGLKESLNELRTAVKNSWISSRNNVSDGIQAAVKSRENLKRIGPYLSNSVRYYRSNLRALRQELVSGFTISVLQIPESVAFSLVAGLQPILGLRATVFLVIIAGIFGAQPGTVNGAAGAMAVVLAEASGAGGTWSNRPYEEIERMVLMTVILTGVFQLAIGLLGLARFARLIPFTVMIGFMNGLAILILISQLDAFKVCPDAADFSTCVRNQTLEWMSLSDGTTWIVILEVVLAAAIVICFPYFKTLNRYCPSALVALVALTAFEHAINRTAINLPVRTVGETTTIQGTFVAPSIPSMPADPDWSTVITIAITMAFVGVVESIMTAQAVTELLQAPLRHSAATQETLAQGLGNFLCGIFGGMGGDGMIGQSTVNVLNGARGRLSTISAGVSLAIITLGLSSVIELVPITCLTGILFIIVIKTFHWPTFVLIFQLSLPDSLGIILVTVLAVTTNLAIAVAAGVVLRALVHVFASSDLLHITSDFDSSSSTADSTNPIFTDTASQDTSLATEMVPVTAEAIKTYYVHGPLFFGSATSFRNYFAPLYDPAHIIIDFSDSLVYDFSGVTALRGVCKRYKANGKKVSVQGLHASSRENMQRDRKLRGFAEAEAEAEALSAHQEPASDLGHLQIFQPTGELNHPKELLSKEDVMEALARDGVDASLNSPTSQSSLRHRTNSRSASSWVEHSV